MEIIMEIVLTKENCQKIIDVIKGKEYKIIINNSTYRNAEFYSTDVFCVYNNMDYDCKLYFFKNNTVVDLELYVMENITDKLI